MTHFEKLLFCSDGNLQTYPMAEKKKKSFRNTFTVLIFGCANYHEFQYSFKAPFLETNNLQ